MNLLMILLVLLAIWICAAIGYFAWRIMPSVDSTDDAKTGSPPSDGTDR